MKNEMFRIGKGDWMGGLSAAIITLPMSIAYGIIVDHKGRITVDSTVGEGTVFTITLPVLQEVADHG